MKLKIIIAVVALAGLLYVVTRKQDENGEEDTSSEDVEDYLNQAGNLLSDAEQNEMKAQANMVAFLAAIRYGEGTARPDGYSVLFGGKTFSSFADHPALLGWAGGKLSDAICKGAGKPSGCVSTAAGAYQIIKPTWLGLKSKLGLTDFSPESQDAAAIELIRVRGALADVQAGRIADAVRKCAKEWASLPSAGYGQREVTLNNFINNFEKHGGVIV